MENNAPSEFNPQDSDPIKGFLEKLNQPKVDHDKAMEELKNIYGQDFRHSYSEIAGYLFGITDAGYSEVEIIANHIKAIFEKIDENYDGNFKKQVFKLYDHINLELVRIKYLINIQEKNKEAERKANLAKYQAEKAIKQAKNTQRDYITILGIFAAIVLAFISGLVFSSSVLQNIDKPNTFKLVSIICFLGIFIVNILNLLFNFIREIHFSKQEQINTCGIWAFNIIIISIAIVCLIGSFEYDEKTRITGENNSTINVNTANISFSPIR